MDIVYGPLAPRRSRLAVASFVVALAGPFACGVGMFVAPLLALIARLRIRYAKGALLGDPWARLAVLISIAWVVLLWSERHRIATFVLARLTQWEPLPPLDPSRAPELEAALDELGRFDVRSRVEGRVRLASAGEAAVPQVVNRLGVLSGLQHFRIVRDVSFLGDARERLRDLLVDLTFRDFGLDAGAWAAWWKEAKAGTRDDWALAALASGDGEARRRGLDWFGRRRECDPRVVAECLRLLRLDDEAIRAEAYAHLVGCADRDFGLDPSRAASEQEEAMAAIERWTRGAGEEVIPMDR